jgi:hypothetical protein
LAAVGGPAGTAGCGAGAIRSDGAREARDQLMARRGRGTGSDRRRVDLEEGHRHGDEGHGSHAVTLHPSSPAVAKPVAPVSASSPGGKRPATTPSDDHRQSRWLASIAKPAAPGATHAAVGGNGAADQRRRATRTGTALSVTAKPPAFEASTSQVSGFPASPPATRCARERAAGRVTGIRPATAQR